MPNVWSNDPNITFAWHASFDNLSGTDGYGENLTQNSPGLPSAIKDIGPVSVRMLTLPGTTGVFHYALRPVDRSGNWNASYASTGPYLLDMVQPNYLTGLASTSHAVGGTSCNPSVTVVWNPTTDNGPAGMAGYSILWSHVPDQHPNLTVDIGNVTSHVQALAVDGQPWYFHITPIDNAGNGQNHYNLGPFHLVSPTPASYCTAKTNSLGCLPAIGSTGSASKSAGNLVITCSNVINQKNGLLFWGFTPAATPFQGGTKCVASPTRRTPNLSSGGSASGNDCSGTYAFAFSTGYMNSVGLVPGDTVHAQWWMRDPASPSTTGLSNALRFTICD
jgi:hypothetical protein